MRTNEKVTPLYTCEDTNVKVRYFVAGEDKLVDVTDTEHRPVGWLHSKVRLDLLEFTETLDGTDKAMDVKVTRLYINDEFIGELFDVKQEETKFGLLTRCDVVIGYNN